MPLLIDNLVRFTQAGSKVQALLGRRPPAVDLLTSTSRILDPRIAGEEHYATAQRVNGVLQRNKDLQDIIAIQGIVMQRVTSSRIDISKRIRIVQ